MADGKIPQRSIHGPCNLNKSTSSSTSSHASRPLMFISLCQSCTANYSPPQWSFQGLGDSDPLRRFKASHALKTVQEPSIDSWTRAKYCPKAFHNAKGWPLMPHCGLKDLPLRPKEPRQWKFKMPPGQSRLNHRSGRDAAKNDMGYHDKQSSDADSANMSQGVYHSASK